MSVWQSACLGDIAVIERDGVHPDNVPKGTLYVGLEHIESGGKFLSVPQVTNGLLASTKFRFTRQHLLYGKLRPYLAKIACPNFSGICSTDILPILPGDRIDRGFLFHFLRQQCMVDYAASRAVGANLPRLSPSVLESFAVPVPPLTEQRRISRILDINECLRTNRRATLTKLDALPQAIFLDMFGDPTTNHRLWSRTPLAELVRGGDTINYGVVQPGDDVEGGVPLVRVGDLQDGRVAHVSLKRISTQIEGAYKRSRLRGDEILVSCVGSTGVVALADDSVKGFNIARAVARIPISDKMDRVFVAAYLRTDFVQRYFNNELRTVSQPTLNIKQISETPVITPPTELQVEFARRFAAVEHLRSAHRDSLAKLDELLTSLQYRAFRGEL